jgi:hypothetical protein
MTYGITFGDLNLHEKWLISVRAEQPGLLASCRTFERWPGVMVRGGCKDISQTFTLSFMDAMRVVQGAGMLTSYAKFESGNEISEGSCKLCKVCWNHLKFLELMEILRNITLLISWGIYGISEYLGSEKVRMCLLFLVPDHNPNSYSRKVE